MQPHPPDSKHRVGDSLVRPKKRPKDSNQDIGLLGKLTYKESRNGYWTENPLLGSTCSKFSIIVIIASVSKEIEACHLDTLPYNGDALGWPLPEPLTLNTEQHILLHILLDGNIEGGQDISIFKIVFNKGIQCVLVQTSYPVCTLEVANLKSSTRSIYGL